jgi:3-(methylthio)propanoyl-CoA dehydrogenase
VAASAHDVAHASPDADEAARMRTTYEFLVPIVKGFATEMSIEVASLGVQVHGGMGYIEETGAAQYYRDARILTIYEGTTAIQANDLLGRKTMREGGRTAKALLEDVRATAASLPADGDLGAIRRRLEAGADDLARAVDHFVAAGKADPRAAHAGSVPYLMLAGTVLAGWQMAKAARIAAERAAAGDAVNFHQAKVATARFYADHILSRSSGYCASIVDGAPGVLALAEDAF